MTLKKIAVILLSAVALSSCIKNPSDTNCGDYLKVNKATLHLANKEGSRGSVMVQSNIAWQVTLPTPTPEWIVINKLAGSNNDSLVVTATKDNITAGYKFASIKISAVNNIAVLPVIFTVVQYDSTFKGK
jgi:hypothetical protein